MLYIPMLDHVMCNGERKSDECWIIVGGNSVLLQVVRGHLKENKTLVEMVVTAVIHHITTNNRVSSFASISFPLLLLSKEHQRHFLMCDEKQSWKSSLEEV